MFKPSRASSITAIGLGLLGGVAVQQLMPSWISQAAAAVAIVGFGLIGWRVGLLIALSVLCGAWRADAASLARTPLGQQIGQSVSIVGVVSDDVGINEKSQASFTLGDVVYQGHPTHQSVKLYTTYKDYRRGQTVEATGKLKTARGAVPLQMSFATTVLLSSKISPLEGLRQRFFTAVRQSLPDPLSGFGLGLLVGVRALIDKPLQATLNATGLSHLVAVSGYNLTIIIQLVRRLFRPISVFTATAISLWVITGFLLVTGFGASIVRAAVVSTLSLIITYYGFQARPITIVIIPAALTVAWNPYYLLHDLGWQLSFLAFYGVIVIAPLIEARMVSRPNLIKSLFIESIAAQLTTTPLILGVFGNISMVAPVTNLVILPLVPLAMALSFTCGLVGMLVPGLAPWVGLPTAGLLGLMIGLVQWFATWPFANLNFTVRPVLVLGMYAVLGLITLALWRAQARSGEVLELREWPRS